MINKDKFMMDKDGRPFPARLTRKLIHLIFISMNNLMSPRKNGSPLIKSILVLIVVSLNMTATFAAERVDFFPFQVSQEQLSGITDFSYFNHPLTSDDTISVKSGHFYTKDGKPIRFFGVNLAFNANFPSNEDAGRLALRLRKLGVNLVRLQQLDARVDPCDQLPSVPNGILCTGKEHPFPSFNGIAIKRLSYLIGRLKKQGIYIDLPIHVAYTFDPQVDGVAEGVPPSSKPVDHFDQKMISKQAAYAKALIKRLGLENNPVLAFAEVSNESSLLYYSKNLTSVVQGPYLTQLTGLWCAWENLPANCQLPPPGNSVQSQDFIRFLAYLDQKYYETIRSTLRAVSRADLPVTGTQATFGGAASLLSSQNMDFIDAHNYIDSYQSKDGKLNGTDWYIRNDGAAANNDNLLQLLNASFQAQKDRPFTVTEFNEPWPNSHGAEGVLLTSLMASLQDWDAIVFYQYLGSATELDRITPEGFGLIGDSSKLAVFGQAAYLFRSRVIPPLKDLSLFQMTDNSIIRVHANTGDDGFHMASALSRIFKLQTDPDSIRKLALNALTSRIRLTRGAPVDSLKLATPTIQPPLLFDSLHGRLTLQSDKAIGFFGRLKSKEQLKLGAMTISNPTTSAEYFTTLALAMDHMSVGESQYLLLTNPGTTRTSFGQNDSRIRDLIDYPVKGITGKTLPYFNSQKAGITGCWCGGSSPIWMKNLALQFVLNRTGKKTTLNVFPLDEKGSKLQPIATSSSTNQQLSFVTDSGSLSPWFEIH